MKSTWSLALGMCLLFIRATAEVPAEKLLKKFGKNGQLDEAQTAKMFESMGISEWSYNGSDEKSCSSSKYFHRTYSKNDGTVNQTDLVDFCPAVLYELSKDACQRKAKGEEEEHGGTEEAGKAWGFGILFVTVISVGSLLGAVMVPFMEKEVFETILMTMISLAVGVLAGSGIFHLIPHALHLGHHDLGYMWKLVMVVCGIYVFFLLECVMKMYLHFKAINDPNTSKTIVNLHAMKTEGYYIGNEQVEISRAHVPEKHPGTSDKEKANGLDLSTPAPPKKVIATVAWMIIIGDGLHNFIDGLAIGVSCSTSVLSGLSTSLAIVCEELPHELGDFAILLSSGMTYKQAMLANFLSACVCYLGLIVGLVLGFKTSAVQWIYGIAGGMFLYISLVDMLPESIQKLQRLCGKSKKKALKLLILQNLAILVGFGAMLVLSFYAHEIKHAEF